MSDELQNSNFMVLVYKINFSSVQSLIKIIMNLEHLHHIKALWGDQNFGCDCMHHSQPNCLNKVSSFAPGLNTQCNT